MTMLEAIIREFPVTDFSKDFKSMSNNRSTYTKEEVDNLMRKSFDFYQSFCSLEKIKKTYSDIFEEVLYFKSMWK